MRFDRYDNERSIEEAERRRHWKTEQIKEGLKKIKEGTSKPYPKKHVLWIGQPKQSNKQVTPKIQIIILTYHNGVKQSVVKKKML